MDDAQAPPSRTAIAVCGCGHDGRLGIGPAAPSTLQEIALLDDFLCPPSLPTTTEPTPLPGTVRQVACGAYHTLVLTSSGLYGWGLHEDGQLGLGRPASANAAAVKRNSTCGGCGALPDDSDVARAIVPPFLDRPTRIPFARLAGVRSGSDDGSVDGAAAHDDDDVACIVSVHCGADHSIVRTTTALYVTGRNDCGQLGLGHMESVHTWTRLCSTVAPAGSRHTLGFRAADCAVVQGSLTHVSCGTHHTLLAWSNALVLRDRGSGPTVADASMAHELFFLPALVVACGRGDFGELGYDGDAWAVLQAKAQRQQRALVAEAQQHQQQQTARGSTGAEQGAQDGATATTYKHKWKAASNVKQRRPAFSSAAFQPVEAEALWSAAVSLPAEVAEAFVAALALGFTSDDTPASLKEHLVQCVRAHGCHCTPPAAAAAVDPALVGSDTHARTHWDVVALHAMHHHSSMTLRASGTPSSAGADPSRVVLHWGCYYCSEVEDAASSVPRRLVDPAEYAANAAAAPPCGIHAGDEIVFRYTTPFSLRPEMEKGGAVCPVQVIGTGNLGRGSSDDEARTWADLPCFPQPAGATGGAAAECPSPSPHYYASAITGRSHFLLSLSPSAPNRAEPEVCSCVVGFGDNLHGQLGAPAVSSRPTEATTDPAGDEDVVDQPRAVLQVGDVLRTAKQVVASLQDASALPHQRHSTVPTEGSVERTQWVVTRIRDVGAGARHSVFVVDVVPRP